MMMLCIAFLSVAIVLTQWLLKLRNPLLMLIGIALFAISSLLSFDFAPLPLQLVLLLALILWQPQRRFNLNR
jgi:hypothetical protein